MGQSSFNGDEALQILVGHLHPLVWLGLSGLDQITDAGLKVLAEAVNLEELVMFGCAKVTGTCFDALKEACPKLKHVYHDFPLNPVIEYDTENATSKKVMCGRYHQVYCLVPEPTFIGTLA